MVCWLTPEISCQRPAPCPWKNERVPLVRLIDFLCEGLIMAKSKVAIAKEKQNYQEKPLSRRCRVCKHLQETTFTKDWGGVGKKLRCKIGGFKVTANAICDLFELDT